MHKRQRCWAPFVQSDMHSAWGCLQSHCSVLPWNDVYRMITPFATRRSGTAPSGKVHTRQNEDAYQRPVVKSNAHRFTCPLGHAWAHYLEPSSRRQASSTYIYCEHLERKVFPCYPEQKRLSFWNGYNSKARASNMAGMASYGKAVAAWSRTRVWRDKQCRHGQHVGIRQTWLQG